LNDTSIFDPPVEVVPYVMSAGVAAAITVSIVCCGTCFVIIFRRWRFIQKKKARKYRKEQLKFLRKREARTANDNGNAYRDFVFGEDS
jgi:hypothetical protein